MVYNLDSHVRRGHPIVFSLLIFFGIIEVAISAWLTVKFSTHHNQKSSTEVVRTHFILFTSCWTAVFSIVYLALFQFLGSSGRFATSVLSHAVFLFLTWILWAAGAAAVTQMIGGGLNCKTQDTFVYCNQLNAMMGFAWIETILVTVGIIIVLLIGIVSTRRGDGIQGQLVSV